MVKALFQELRCLGGAGLTRLTVNQMRKLIVGSNPTDIIF